MRILLRRSVSIDRRIVSRGNEMLHRVDTVRLEAQILNRIFVVAMLRVQQCDAIVVVVALRDDDATD